MEKTQGLSVRELLREVYNTLKEGGEEIKLPSIAMAEIARDSDMHRPRIGCIVYEAATVLEVNEKEWILAFGTASKDYLSDPYNCDIAAMQFSSNGKSVNELASEIHDALKENHYFHHSLIYAKANGKLALNKDGHFCQKILKLLRPKDQEFVAQELETDSRYYTADLQPAVVSAIRYKPEFVVFLCNVLYGVLVS